MPMKLIVASVVVVFGLICAGFAVNGSDLAAQGYRWITIDGPYACLSQDDLRRVLVQT
jgi:hypothetical protein